MVPETQETRQHHNTSTENGNEAVDGECHTDSDNIDCELSTDDDKDFGDTQYQSPADMMDMVTVSVDGPKKRPADISADVKRRLIAKVKKAARNHQLKSELRAKSGIADRSADTQAPDMEILTRPSRNNPEIHDETAVVMDSKIREPTLETTEQEKNTGMDPPPAPVEDCKLKQQSDQNKVAGMDPSPLESVDPPSDHAKKTNKRTKNKRKVNEALPKRQLRSSTKNKSISEITPEMIETFARNQCQKTVQVPASTVRQSKRAQVAPNSPHPTRDELEDKLRVAMALGQNPTAYLLDTGQSGALRAMDLVVKQRWVDLAHTEASADSEDFSD